MPRNLSLSPSARIAARHDFNGDGRTDILWHDLNGMVAVRQMDGMQIASDTLLDANPGNQWRIPWQDQGDFDGDGKADMLWSGAGGEVAIWEMDGAHIIAAAALDANPGRYRDPSIWHPLGRDTVPGSRLAALQGARSRPAGPWR